LLFSFDHGLLSTTPSAAPPPWQVGDELSALAKANGYQMGAYQEEDSRRDRNKHIDKVKKDQDAALDRYVL
jgi:hypothetical protein